MQEMFRNTNNNNLLTEGEEVGSQKPQSPGVEELLITCRKNQKKVRHLHNK